MKQLLVTVLLSIILLLKACGETSLKGKTENKAGKQYVNEAYRFSVRVPETWKLYGQIQNDTVHHKAIVDWELPKIYSDLEKTDIENSISITAYHRADIHSVSELIQSEYLRINPAQTALEIDTSNPNARMIYTTTANGLKYKGRSYYIFKNDIGYIITFMATPGTYNKNIEVFEKFYTTIEFL